MHKSTVDKVSSSNIPFTHFNLLLFFVLVFGYSSVHWMEWLIYLKLQSEGLQLPCLRWLIW
ncbi:hypothetical protein Bca101_031686 [Brassica carinata]